MNDRFKFRAWDEETKTMVYFNFEDIRMRSFSLQLYALINDNSVQKMQCTGLKNKNGNLIFEGDILAFTVFDQYRGVVVFAEGGWQLWASIESEFYGSDGAFDLYWVVNQDDENEIIGNKYENPELLKDVVIN